MLSSCSIRIDHLSVFPTRGFHPAECQSRASGSASCGGKRSACQRGSSYSVSGKPISLHNNFISGSEVGRRALKQSVSPHARSGSTSVSVRSFKGDAGKSSRLIPHAAAGTNAPVEQASAAAPKLRGLYLSVQSHQKGHLQVSELHTIYYEVLGNPKGKPALFLHGGPGAGCYANHARFFDPQHYRIVLFDQRACGASSPRGCLEENTTWDLVADIEKLRSHLKVDKWLVMGGSWGVTLALAYAQAHSERVAALVLRGVCLLRQQELDWFYKQGASSLFPFGWEALVSTLGTEERRDVIASFYARFTCADSQVREAAVGPLLPFSCLLLLLLLLLLQLLLRRLQWSPTCACLAKAWLKWEMGLSFFSASPFVYAWDGHQYSTLPGPQAGSAEQQKPQPNGRGKGSGPRPSSPAPSSASASPPGSASSAASSSSSSTPPASSSFPSTSTAGASADGNSGGTSSHSHSATSSPSSSSSPPPSSSPVTAAPSSVTSGAGSSEDEQGPRVSGEERRRRAIEEGKAMSGTLVQARLECHYFHNKGFLRERQLLDDIERIRHVPGVIVQGRFDFVCPLQNAFDLHRAWPQAHLRVVPNAGHSMYEPGIIHELVCATDKFKTLLY
eukprot:jgi/Mesen1/7361/ME000381S06600